MSTEPEPDQVAVNPARIVIVAPSMRPSLDGVADYATKLATQLKARGREVLLIGLNDFHPDADDFDVVRDGVRILNFSAYRPWADRELAILARWRGFEPDALTIQYYWRGYWAGHNYARIAKFLRELGRTVRRQIMYHETWEDSGANERIPRFIRAPMMALIIARFHYLVRPHVTFTNTHHHTQQLRLIGLSAINLPIPSSIVVMPRDTAADDAIWRLIQDAGLGPIARKDVWVAIIFGRVRPEWPAEDALPSLQRAWKASGRTHAAIISIGRTAYGDQGWQRVVTQAQGAGLITVKLGIRPEESISRILALADLGVATTADRLLEKSSTYAAMLDHGLPVFVLDRRALPASKTGARSAQTAEPNPTAAPFEKSPALPTTNWSGVCEAYLRALAHSH